MGDDDKPGKLPRPAHIAAKLRRYAQDIDDRDAGGNVGRRPRTAQLEYDSDHASPVEIHAEATGVEELARRAEERMDARGVDPAVRAASRVLLEVLAEHQTAGERRAANRDMEVAAGRPALIAQLPWWTPLVKALPALLSIGGVLVTTVLWVRNSASAAEREAGDLRARLVQIESDIKSLRRSQEWLWRRIDPDPAPVFPALPGDQQP